MRVSLTGGAYQARSIIANAQASINLYPENNPQGDESPAPVTHYPTPGLTLLEASNYSIYRCAYRASQGDLYVVIAQNVYYVSPTWSLQLIGSIGSTSNICYMADNGVAILLVDSTKTYYAINLQTRAFVIGSDPNYGGADRIDYLSTFFVCNISGTNEWQQTVVRDSGSPITTPSWVPVFTNSQNPGGAIGQKIAWADPIQTLIVMHTEVWLIGQLTTEIWYNAGNIGFVFSKIPNVFIEQGCVAKYSIAKQDLNVYWLSQDLQGQAIVMRGHAYAAARISTHAIEQAISNYSRIDDAIGFTYQIEGHTFYILTFPTADATWVFDEATSLWHQRAWTDDNGILHRIRANVSANAYGKIVVGDWQNGNLYNLDPNNYTDNGQPITRLRTFPHLMNDNKRVSYNQFIADMETGDDTGSIDGSSSANPPVVSLSWSDDRGRTYGNQIEQSLGAGGQYLTNIQWRRLGIARDRIFKLEWSSPAFTALNGAFIELEEAET